MVMSATTLFSLSSTAISFTFFPIIFFRTASTSWSSTKDMSYQWSQSDGAEEFPIFIHDIKQPGMFISDHGINYFFNA
jgi:hypothetical protein